MKKFKKNKKGFSLVELIAAVAILGVVVSPLLHSFVTSTNVSRRAIEIADANLAGKNILEAVDACSIGDFKQIADSELDTNTLVNLLKSDYNNTEGTKLEICPIGRFDEFGKLATRYLKTDGSPITDTELKQLLLSDPGNQSPDDKNKEGNFSIGIKNLKSGGSVFDAKVDFSRGDPTPTIGEGDDAEDSTSYGFFEINNEKIAKYDRMDGVFSQPYISTSNPDILADEKFFEAAKTDATIPDNEYLSRKRTIEIETMKDTNGLIWAWVTYDYRFEYHVQDVDSEGFTSPAYNGESPKTAYWPNSTGSAKFKYTVFPGGYEAPADSGGAVSLYMMFFPDCNSTGKNDKNTIDDDDIVIYNIADDPYDVDLTVYLYKQDPILYTKDDPDTEESEEAYTDFSWAGKQYNAKVTIYMPMNFEYAGEIAEDDERETLVYTNIHKSRAAGNNVDYHFAVASGNYMGDVDFDHPDSYDPDDPTAPKIFHGAENNNYAKYNYLVRQEKLIRIYDVKVTIYAKDSFNPVREVTEGEYYGTDVELVDTTASTFDGKVIYIINGTKTP